MIKFKKDASPESKQKTLDDIKKNGGKILKDDNVNNPREYAAGGCRRRLARRAFDSHPSAFPAFPSC